MELPSWVNKLTIHASFIATGLLFLIFNDFLLESLWPTFKMLYLIIAAWLVGCGVLNGLLFLLEGYIDEED